MARSLKKRRLRRNDQNQQGEGKYKPLNVVEMLKWLQKRAVCKATIEYNVLSMSITHTALSRRKYTSFEHICNAVWLKKISMSFEIWNLLRLKATLVILNYRMKIVDDDIDWRQLAVQEEEENKEEDEEEAPVVCKRMMLPW